MSSQQELPKRATERWPYIVIAAVVSTLVLAFGYTTGWLSGRLTPARMVDALEANGVAPGFRRAHGRGFCVAGYFESNGAGARLSKAAMMAPGRTDFIGRMSIAGGPTDSEATARVRSMALRLVQSDGREWRMAMNSFPVFPVATPHAFHEQILAGQPDPKTGKPDPARLAAFADAHPEGAAFRHWAGAEPFTDSLASTAFNSVNAFLFDSPDGRTHAVRWSMQPTVAAAEMDADTRAAAPPDYLERELASRLAAGPVRWRMVVTVARPGDPTNDPTQAWPDDRERVVVGEVVIETLQAHSTGQASAACRDINFDPLILPPGVRASDDPILHARSAVYSVSATRRLRESAAGSIASAAP